MHRGVEASNEQLSMEMAISLAGLIVISTAEGDDATSRMLAQIVRQ